MYIYIYILYIYIYTFVPGMSLIRHVRKQEENIKYLRQKLRDR